MVYTVKQLCRLSGLSSRALHYYDVIGLLKPSYSRSNGYRCYEEKELLKLQQILFFREMEFSLEQIKKIFAASNFERLEVLKDQKKLLEIKKIRIEKLLKTINETIETSKGGVIMKDEEMFGGLTKEQMDEYKKEVERKYDPKIVQQSFERTKSWTKEDYKKIQEEGNDISLKIVKNMDLGFESPEIQLQIARHFAQINKFYDCSYEIYLGLGKLYVDDQRFADNYRKYDKNLPEFIQKAMDYFCDQRTSQ